MTIWCARCGLSRDGNYTRAQCSCPDPILSPEPMPVLVDVERPPVPSRQWSVPGPVSNELFLGVSTEQVVGTQCYLGRYGNPWGDDDAG